MIHLILKHDATAYKTETELFDESVNGETAFTSPYIKNDEINELTGGNFDNIKNYVDINLNKNLVIALTVENQRYIVKDANAENLSLALYLKEIITDYLNLDTYAASGIAFNNFMKSEPKFNAVTGELIKPFLSLDSLFE